MKRIPTIILTCLLVLSFTVYVFARSERSKVEYYEKQTFKSDTEHQKEMKFGPNASITSDKNVYPENFIKNSQLAIWSGGTRWGSGGLASVPDGWYIPSLSTFTGVTRIDVNTISPVSSVTPSFTHSMLLSTWDATTGAGNTNYIAYPNSGVSAVQWWRDKFAGKTVVFGAFVKRDLGQYVASGVSTNFIRPFVHIGQNYKASEVNYTFGDYIEKAGWTLATMEYDVPAGVSAFEVGFAMNPTVLAPPGGSSTGDSVYVVAPFLLINPLNKEYVANPKEIIFLNENVNAFTAGASTFGAMDDLQAGTVLDLSADDGWGGIIPDDAEAIYTTVKGDFASTADPLHFYSVNIDSGVTIYPNVAAGVATFNNVWIPVSPTGTITVDNVAVVTGVSLQVHGVQMR